MSDNNKSYRIRTNVGNDSVLKVNLNQDFNVLEVLSLNIDTDNLYRFHTSDYGCIAGRVLANGNFGIPNAKISIFIAIDDADSEDDIISYLYPYRTTASKNVDKIRYNLLPEEQLSDCHRNVGTFPSKRTVLDDNHVLEIYDKYYKYTTRSNESGDYMIFGVPTGSQTLHVDIDLSDIGSLSQRPRDMVYKGYNVTQFENGNMFKKSNNLDSLAQIITQNQNVYVYPFWGENSESDIAITRRDIEIQYEFTPTCVFIGSLITDEPSNGISKRCIPSERMGKMDRLTTGSGTIEMIRKTPNGGTEEVVIQGNTLIDGNGTWCYQIPMNLDYVKTDEYGNTVPTDDPTKGVATRACVRFRFSLTEFENEGGYSHVSKVLVPHNPKYYNAKERGDDKEEAILDYVFGTNTDDASFKNLFSNNVYTVKSFIPRFQMLNIDRNKRFSGIKATNVNSGNNPIPYNNIRVDLTFMFVLQCAIFKMLLWVVTVYNKFMTALYGIGHTWLGKKVSKGIRTAIRNGGACIYIGEGYCPEMDGWYFAPGCNSGELRKDTFKRISKDEDNDTESIDYENKDSRENGGRICLTNKINYFVQCVEINLAMEHEVIQFDFYNDWVNGMIYAPRWFADIRPKRSYLFGLIRVSPRINGCMESGYRAMFSRRYAQQCALSYTVSGNGADYTVVTTAKGCKSGSTKQKCHKAKGRQNIKIFTSENKPGGGVVHDEQTLEKKYAYYFRPCEWFKSGRKGNLFATDIVLLGSLDKNNAYGIPQTFEKLTSTSYQIPDTLASTNMGIDGYIYGQGGGAICNGITTEAISKLPNDKLSIEEWSEGKDFYESAPYDANEPLITEAAGIDWGYSGPGQGNNDFDKLYYPGGHFLGISCVNSETNIKSCINLSRICEQGSIISQRQTLIKKSSKDSADTSYTYSYLIPTGLISGESINDYGFKNEFATLNYNGLKIKQDERTLLSKYDFETINPINFNGELYKFTNSGETPYNNITGKAEEGGDSIYVRTIEENSSDYYRFRFGLPLNHTKEEAKKRFLRATGDTVSLPVYENSFYFYFGLKGGNTAIDRFFKDFYAECQAMKSYEPEVNVVQTSAASFCVDDGEVLITLMNIEGGTVKINNPEDAPNVEMTGETGSKTFRIGGLPGDTEISISVYGDNISQITKVFSVDTNYPESFSGISYTSTDYTEEYAEFETGDTSGRITILSQVDNGVFQDTSVFGIAIVTSNFLEESNKKPYAKIIRNPHYNGEGAAVYEREIRKEYSVLEWESHDLLSNTIVSTWAGNKDYTIKILYACNGNERLICTNCWRYYQYEGQQYCQTCGEGIDKAWRADSQLKTYDVDTVLISMPSELNVIFDNYTYASYKYLIKPLIEKTTGEEQENVRKYWFNALLQSGTTFQSWTRILTRTSVFSGTTGETRLKNAIYHIKRALLYRGSQAEINSTNGIPITIEGGTPPYTTQLEGYGERTEEGDEIMYLRVSPSSGSVNDMEASGYTMDIAAFVSPTINFNGENEIYDAPSAINYNFDYKKMGNNRKGVYRLKIKDSSGRGGSWGIDICIPSIYRPFFGISLYISEISSNPYACGQTFKTVVANALSPHTSDNADVKIEYTAASEAIMLSAPNRDYEVSEVMNPIEKIYKLIETKETSTGSNSIITGGSYTVAITEDGGNGEKREVTLNANFIGDGAGTDRRVRYIPITQDVYKALKTATVIDKSGSNRFINYQLPHDYKLLSDSIDPRSDDEGNGFLFSPLLSAVLKETNTNFSIGSTLDVNQNEISYDAIVMAPEDEAKSVQAAIGERYGVVGIAETDYYYADELDDSEQRRAILRNPSNYMYSYSPRHETRIIAIRLYTSEVFISLVKQPYKKFTEVPLDNN